MLVFAGHIRVPADKQAALQPALEDFVRATRDEPGCQGFSFAYDALEPETLRIFEIFDDEAAFIAHGASAHMQAWRAARAALQIDGRVLTRYDISSHQAV